VANARVTQPSGGARVRQDVSEIKAPSKRITPMVDHLVRETDKLTLTNANVLPQ
jgi:hypothetical protein